MVGVQANVEARQADYLADAVVARGAGQAIPEMWEFRRARPVPS